MTLTKEIDLIPFPPLSEELQEQFGVKELFLRAFGLLAVDRDVNFARPLRPYLETQILDYCTQDRSGVKLDSEFFWHLQIGTRIEGLLSIAALTDSPNFVIALRCLNSNCREAIEIELSLQELTYLQRQGEQTPLAEIQLSNQKLLLRKPKGLDQLQWLQQSFPDATVAAKKMIQTLLVSPLNFNLDENTGEDWILAFDEAMEDIDPLVNFKVGVNCPYCNAQDKHTIDLGALALQKLRHVQEQFLSIVHRLASRYHWTESEIFSLAPWRRNYYLSLIEREEIL